MIQANANVYWGVRWGGGLFIIFNSLALYASNTTCGYNLWLGKTHTPVLQLPSEVYYVTLRHSAQMSNTLIAHSTGANFTKGLKSRFRLKFKTLVVNLC